MPEEKLPNPDRVNRLLQGVEQFMGEGDPAASRGSLNEESVVDEPIVPEGSGTGTDDVRTLEHAVRCACVHLSNFSKVNSHAEMSEKVPGTDTTVTYIHRRTPWEDVEQLLTKPGYATLHSYHPDADSSQQYFRGLDLYSQVHALDSGEGVTLSGPGMITMCGVNHIDTYQHEKAEWLTQNTRNDDSPDAKRHNSRVTQAVDTPVFLKVQGNQVDSGACTDSTMDNIRNGRVHGMIFRDSRDLSRFADWYNEKRSGISGSKLADGEVFTSPTLVLRGDPNTVYEAIKSGDAKYAHAFFFDRPLSASQANDLRDARAGMMAQSHSPEPFYNPYSKKGTPGMSAEDMHRLKIAVVNVQGAARLEAAMIALASKKVPGMSVEIALVQTRRQIEELNPDALVLPGGWHFIQHRMQQHPETGINAILEEMIEQQRVHVLGSCAGAILMRRPDVLGSRSIDCVPETANGMMPYTVKNNARSGRHDTQFLTHSEGGDKLINFPNALYVSAPELIVDANAQNLKTIAETNGETYGVIQRTDHHSPVHAATALHNKLPYVYWLHEIQENLAVQRMRGQHGKVEGDVNE
jgi:glutamine amidotransferase PdxT